jgi:hypothetical protein
MKKMTLQLNVVVVVRAIWSLGRTDRYPAGDHPHILGNGSRPAASVNIFTLLGGGEAAVMMVAGGISGMSLHTRYAFSWPAPEDV